jgi:hypothetical protein
MTREERADEVREIQEWLDGAPRLKPELEPSQCAPFLAGRLLGQRIRLPIAVEFPKPRKEHRCTSWK